MPILMEEPLKLMMNPNIVRYGAILKNVDTGRIVGHLKETGEMGRLLSNLPIAPVVNSLNPISITADIIFKAVNTAQINNVQKSIEQVQQSLEALQLTTNIAAVSSIATLGVSVAGFAVVTSKLNKIGSKLDGVADSIAVIRKALEKSAIQWEAMSTARLQRAAEFICSAEKADNGEIRNDYLRKAVEDFSLMRPYYSALLGTDGLFSDVDLSVEQLQELIAKYTFCCMGLLHAAFMRGDLGSYRSFLESIESEFSDIVSFSPKELYLARSDRLDVLAIDYDHKAQSEALIGLSRYNAETVARIESHRVELEYLENNDLTVDEYLSALRDHETELVLLPR
jgi:hypothetical protein